MDLLEYAKGICPKYADAPRSQLSTDIEFAQAEGICLFCGVRLSYYTTKKDWTYLANGDRSPHRKSYSCSGSWSKYNSIGPVETKDPKWEKVRKRGLAKKYLKAINDPAIQDILERDQSNKKS